MYPALKRGLDAVGACIALIPLSVLFIPIIVILACTGEHQVFYRQTRIGRAGRDFGILKFATMLKASPGLAGGSLTVRGDPRVLPFGRFLRASKINELPQVINVLIGDMSFVGPRPQVRGDFDHYSAEVQAAVTSVRPGITGIGSVIFRDEEQFLSRPGIDPRAFYGEHIAPYKGALEQWYRAHISLRTDFLILWSTAWTIVRPTSGLVFRVFPDLPARPSWWGEGASSQSDLG